jgi:glucan 1,3-beta-glucosidase
MTFLRTNTTTGLFHKKENAPPPRWIRGVNLGGWLVLERYIVPYQFAVTDCHVHAKQPSDLCWYEGALSAPPPHSLAYQPCDLTKCKPYLQENIFNQTDYPVDEWHLAEAFDDTDAATAWFNSHFSNFITQDDFRRIKKAGLTHVRIPLPHWILGNVQDDEPWIVGHRWQALQRAVDWARELGLQVWPNLQ